MVLDSISHQENQYPKVRRPLNLPCIQDCLDGSYTSMPVFAKSKYPGGLISKQQRIPCVYELKGLNELLQNANGYILSSAIGEEDLQG